MWVRFLLSWKFLQLISAVQMLYGEEKIYQRIQTGAKGTLDNFRSEDKILEQNTRTEYF